MKPSIPKGTRDFSPEEVNKRNYIFDTIREVFIRYGYQPIETPAMEDLSTLTGKYGEEGDQLLFKVLNNGDFLAKADEEALEARDSNRLIPSISKRGLRYDLTVPFARYVVMHQNDITFPFKRYQIQPVWRADRPQKGRYQEFYQCDVDVVGSDSLVYEAELIQIYDEVFAALGLDVTIYINNRKVLKGIAEVAGVGNKFIEFVTILDKLDKVGPDGVKRELFDKGFSRTSIDKIEYLLSKPIYQIGIVDPSISELGNLLKESTDGMQGIHEIQTVFEYLTYSNNSVTAWTTSNNKIALNTTLARGLGYYTGCIFEVVINTNINKQSKVKMGSIGGGGRYDDLTGVFGMAGTSGVGISFGAERIFDVMEELQLFPDDSATRLKVVLLAFDDNSHLYAFRCLKKLREAGINAEIYPEPTKIGKQFKYVDKRNAPYAIVVGSKEMESGELAFKNMKTGDQENLTLEAIIQRLKS